jgi:N-acetylglucosaminyldiphosphoundecaprenol N-acetyl-beta-D-mannosaminyltransferase
MRTGVNILDLEIEYSNYDALLVKIQSKIESKTHFSFLNVNSYIALKAKKDSVLKEYLKRFSILYPDGIGIHWASKILYGKFGAFEERINGTDLYNKILKFAQTNNYRVFFLGGGTKAVNKLNTKYHELFPNLNFGGIISRYEAFREGTLDRINASNADILFLGLGTPNQEKWIATFGQKCNVPIQIACGSGIEFMAGVYPRAPKLMRKIGLEWMFRLFLEPKRLWKRYLIGIPHFIFLIIKQKISSENYLD